jgi:drug/metabolite transporter (DMT)-like permease
VIALLGGLGAALCWAISALCASAASRAIGSTSTLAWVMGIGLLLIVIPTALLAPVSQLTPRTVGLIALAGATNVIGLLIEYVAFRRGKVGVISAIASTEGVIAAVIAVVLGAHLALGTGAVLLVVAAGVVVAAARDAPADGVAAAAQDDPASAAGVAAASAAQVDPVAAAAASAPTDGVRSAVLAIPVALLFGVSLYATGHVGSEISVLWVLVPARALGTVFLLAPLRLRGALALTAPALPLVGAAAAAEALGIVSYELGARHGIAVAAVTSSQFAALAALGAFFVMRERLTRLQLTGLGVIAVGVAVLAAIQA